MSPLTPRLLSVLPVLLGAAACRPPDDKGDGGGGDAGPDPYDVPVGPYDATIRWTSYGIPHIEAADHGSLAYGMGYAFARDHACVLADQVLMVRSERARFFGPGPGDIHIATDFGWKGLRVFAQAEEGFFSLSADVQDALVGYAAGYNRYITESAAALPDDCRGAPWVRPVTHIDLLAYYLAFGLNASGAIFVDAVGTAAPPTAARATGGFAPPPSLDRFGAAHKPTFGSNGWAIGRDRSASGGGALLSNTHFPAEGERKWHESHLTIPGELDVYGVSLMGVPVINIGFNDAVAWTHTVSYTPRFTAALLSLDPADPTRYAWDGGMREMVPTTHRIEVLQSDGSLETLERTLWDSHWGPVLNAPVLGWNERYALALADANRNNLRMADTWLALNRARSIDAVEAALETHAGIPWVHILAADASGDVLYADPGSAPDWSAEAEARYPAWLDAEPLAALFDDAGAITVDGSDPVFSWVEAADQAVPGLVPYARSPRARRTDLAFNANDNHWFTHPTERLGGYAWIFGPEGAPPSARTRQNARFLAADAAAAGEDGRFTVDELEAAALSGVGLLAAELREGVAARCRSAGTATADIGDGAQTVDLGPACAALEGWGGTVRLDDRGAPLWREFLTAGTFSYADTVDAGALFAVPFDPADPLGTPAGLAPAPASGEDPVAAALATAVLHLAAAGFGPDASLRETQFLRKGGDDLPVPGGTFWEGVIQIADYDAGNATLLPREPVAPWVNPTSGLSADGHQMNNGNSWVMAMAFTPEGPSARALMTYSQSGVPGSPHFTDQTARYGEEQLRPILFTAAEIAADPNLETLTLRLE